MAPPEMGERVARLEARQESIGLRVDQLKDSICKELRELRETVDGHGEAPGMRGVIDRLRWVLRLQWVLLGVLVARIFEAELPFLMPWIG